MSFFDQPVYIIFFAVIIIVFLSSMYVWNAVYPSFTKFPNGSPNTVTLQMNTSINESVGFWNTSFAAIYILVSLGSILLTIFLRSNPALLAIWILLNCVVLFVWDSVNTVLTAFIATPLNGGQMNMAIAFFQSGIPQLIPIVNMLIGIFIFGKNAFTSTQGV